MALFRFGVVYPRLSSPSALGSRGQKFALLEKCNDRLAAARTERVCRPLNPGNDLFMPVLNFFFTDIALAYEHRPKTDYLCPRRSCFQLTDTGLVLFKSVFMAAQLFGTGYIFYAMVLKFFQNRVQF